VTKAPTIITTVPAKGHTGSLPSTSLDHHISILVASQGNLSFMDPIWCFRDDCPSTVGHAVAVVRSSQSQGKPSSRNHGEEICHDPCHAKFAQSRPVINFHWRIVHSRFHDLKYYVFWTGCFCTPARSLNNPRWVITRVLPGTDRGTFVMIVGALVTWAIYTQGQLLSWSSLIITGDVLGYK